ncbi:class E sortase [Actinomadura madurae]|uniref:class E sortase n=1 Tax=Actinomadura madurae TaxID=1993 RepID=UPI0020D22238|nr:class E sortase [Actinomadura madurae]MCQ0016935.1 class E sortase [Actinomadura madurae]
MLGRKSLCAVAVAAFCALPAVSVPPAQAAPARGTAAVAATAARPRTGTVIARLQIRRMGLKTLVRQGVGRAVLRRGVGHYPGTALPGRAGNTVLLGHRTTWRHPFGELDRMRRGDRIVLRVGPADLRVPGPAQARHQAPGPARSGAGAVPPRQRPGRPVRHADHLHAEGIGPAPPRRRRQDRVEALSRGASAARRLRPAAGQRPP